MRTSPAAVALAVWCALALSSEAAPTSGAPEQCVCQSSDADRALQLIRGEGQVTLCEGGYYCNCQEKAVLHCDEVFMGLSMQFNEESQMCEFEFNCRAFLADSTSGPPTLSPPTLAPTQPPAPAETTAAAPTPAPAPEPCACKDETMSFQLIRGADQEAHCRNGDYCACKAKTVQHCDSFMNMPMQFNEDSQMCEFAFDCEYFFAGPTERPSPPIPTEKPTQPPKAPTAAAPTPAPEPCACKDETMSFQLIRGADQVAQCRNGDYCACRAKTVQHCDSFMNMPMQFNEDSQMCEFDFDCQSFLQETVTSAPSPGSSSKVPSPATTNPFSTSGGSSVALSATLFSVSAAIMVINLLLFYRRSCCSQGGRVSSVPYDRQLNDPVPTVFSPDWPSTRKVPMESVA